MRVATDLPGDQLTGTLPIQVHAGRSELLQEHVDLAVEPRTSRHAASLGERDKLGGGYAASATGSGAWSRPVPAAEVAVELVVEDAGADLQQEVGAAEAQRICCFLTMRLLMTWLPRTR